MSEEQANFVRVDPESQTLTEWGVVYGIWQNIHVGKEVGGVRVSFIGAHAKEPDRMVITLANRQRFRIIVEEVKT